VKGCLLSAVDGLSSGGTFSCDKEFCGLAELVRILKLDLDEWSTSAGVVDDVLYNTLDETVSFGVVDCSVLCGALSGSLNCLENTSGTFTACSDDASHVDLSVRQSKSDSKMG